MALPNLVLIVDDEPIGRSSLQTLLAQDGYRLETAPDGPTAIDRAIDLQPDVILLDVMMPGVDGFEVTRRMRAVPALADVPIVLVTALDDAASRLTGFEAGADDFVSKPFDRIELRARVRSITRLNRFRRLTVARERYRRLFDLSPCALCLVDAGGRVGEANAVATALLARWLGPSAGDLTALFPPADLPRFRELLHAAAGEPATAPRGDFAAETAAGPVWFEVAVSRVPGDDEQAFQVAISDRTAARLLEDELHQAQKVETVGQLAGGIAHDFNNLLTVINGFSKLALDRTLPTEPAWEMIDEVYKAGERAAALTRQLLAFSHKSLVNPVELDLNAQVRETEAILRRLVGEHLVVRTHLAADAGRVKADPGQVEQVLFNLAVNARDAMPAGGELTIATEVLPGTGGGAGWVRLIVADTGGGMTPAVRARIFEPFFTTKGVGKGTGLGLATVARIVHQSGGRIGVTSEVGRGTRFAVDFPRLAGPPAEPALADQVRPPGGTETILFAEDEAAVRSFAHAALTTAGYTVLVARDGEDALAASRGHGGTIDLLFTDAVMPRLGGRGLAEQLRVLRPGVRVLITSGYHDDPGLRDDVRSGVAFLPKPYTAVPLLQKVREVLDQ